MFKGKTPPSGRSDDNNRTVGVRWRSRSGWEVGQWHEDFNVGDWCSLLLSAARKLLLFWREVAAGDLCCFLLTTAGKDDVLLPTTASNWAEVLMWTQTMTLCTEHNQTLNKAMTHHETSLQSVEGLMHVCHIGNQVTCHLDQTEQTIDMSVCVKTFWLYYTE